MDSLSLVHALKEVSGVTGARISVRLLPAEEPNEAAVTEWLRTWLTIFRKMDEAEKDKGRAA